MNRREVVAGGAASVAAAAIPDIAIADQREWECAVISRLEFPDDWRQWDKTAILATKRSIRRLLDKNPLAKIVSDTSICMKPGHPRYPEVVPGQPGAFWLVRTIKLDRAAVNG